MKKLFLLSVVYFVTTITFAQNIQEEVNNQLKDLPFDSFSIKVPVFKDKVYNIKDFGAVGDGMFKNTDVINKVIQKCSAEGGGMVIIPAGLWNTAAITMQSNVNLHLEEGALVSFSAYLDDYQLVKGKIPSLINGSKLENVAITGPGIFNGSGDKWRPVKKSKMNDDMWKDMVKSGGVVTEDGSIWYPREKALEAEKLLKSKKYKDMTEEEIEQTKPYLRSYMLSLDKCKHVFIEGVTLQNSPKFSMIMRSCDEMVLKNVKALNEWWAQNADGLDISACKNVLVYDCTVNTGDDGICMKSSHEKPDQYRLENIVIKDSKVYHAHGGFVIGSNTDGKIRNIYVNNCSFSWTETGLRFKSGADRGGLVENIFVDGIYMKDIEKEAIIFDLSYEDKGAVKVKGAKVSDEKIPDFNGFSIKNVFVDGAEKACRIDGFEECNVKNVSFENMVIQAKKGITANYSKNISFKNVKLQIDDEESAQLNNVNDLTFDAVVNISNPLKLDIKGDQSKGIKVENSNLTKDDIILEEGVKKKEVSIL